MYKITKITTLDGSPRTDGRYPLRIGCIGKYDLMEVGYPLVFAYYLDADGNEKQGTLQTSTVVKIAHEARHIEITTRNSIYTLVLV